MSATQLLQYVANKASEEEARELLGRSNVLFRIGATDVGYTTNGELRNSQNQIVTAAVGAVTGFSIKNFKPSKEVGSVTANSSRQPTLEQQAEINKRNKLVPGQPIGKVVSPDDKNEIATTKTQIGSGQTVTEQKVPGSSGVTTTSDVGKHATEDAAQKHAAIGGGVPNAKAEPAKAEPAKAEPAKAEPAKAEPAKALAPKGDKV